MPKINIRLKKQAIKLHLVRSVHLDARKIALTNIFYSCNKLHATGSVDYFCMRRLLAFLRGALYAKAKLNTTGDDMLNETKPQTPFQEKISSLFEQSLTEEQRFLQGILRGEIQTFSHEEIVATLRETLKR